MAFNFKTDIICGCDPSPNKTAFVFLQNGELIHELYTTDVKKLLKNDKHAIELDPKKIIDLDKLVLMEDIVADIIRTIKPKYIGIEDFSLGSTFQTYPVGGMQYLIRLLFYKANIPMKLYRPDKIKKFVANNGHSDKNIMIAKCITRWGIDFSDYSKNSEDLADAFGVAKLLEMELMVRNKLIKPEKLLSYEHEVLFNTTPKNLIPTVEQAFIMKA